MASVWVELRRRNVVKVAAAYAIVGWLLIEIAATVLPIFEAPSWTLQVFTFFLILGFPVALILSWAYELTPQGIERTVSVPLSESITKVTGRRLDFVIIGLMTFAIGFLVVDNYVLERTSEADAVAVDRDPGPRTVGEQPSAPSPVVADEQRDPGRLPNSVAVLPFANRSPDPANAYFADGIHDSILNELGKLSSVNVIARTSVLRYADEQTPIPEIAAALNVETVMEGSVQYADGRILVTAQLIDPGTSAQLWSSNYDRQFADIFAIQADIAMNIANALEAEFSAEEQASLEQALTDSPAAYSRYMRALNSWYSDEGTAWNSIIDEAIALDPEFALAYATKAYLNAVALVGVGTVAPGDVAELERITREAADRALELDPNLGKAQAALAALHQLAWRGAEAEQAFQRAYELSPDADVALAYGRFKRYRGEYDEGIRLTQRAVQLDPHSWLNHDQLAHVYRFSRNNAAASAAYRKALELNPLVGAGTYVNLGLAEAANGNAAEALRQVQLAVQFELNTFRLSQLALVCALADRPEDAARFFEQFQESAIDNPVSDAIWARAYLAIGDYDAAYERLESAVSDRISTDLATLSEIAANPWADPVLDEPRFTRLLSGLWEDG